MASQLMKPPSLHLPTKRRDRHATWLELFYDLVFSVAISVLGSRLSNNISLIGIAQFVALFLPVWWAWCGYTVYNTRFDTDDLFQRLCTFGMMVAAAAMAVYIPQAFEGKASLFAIAYVVARGCILIQYIRAWYYVPEARTIIKVYLTGFGVGVGLWIVAIFISSPICYILWAIGLAIDLVTPWLGRPILSSAPLDTSHLPERFASFTIIVLGEIIYVIVSGVANSHVTSISFVAAVLAFGFTACIWWVYFTFIEEAPFVNNLGSGQPYIYVHLPIVIGLTLIGVGLGRAVQEAAQPVLLPDTRWLIAVGITIWVFAALVLKLIAVQRWPSAKLLLRIIVVSSIIVIMSLGYRLSSLIVLAALLVVFVIFVIFEVRYWRNWSKNHEKTSAQDTTSVINSAD